MTLPIVLFAAGLGLLVLGGELLVRGASRLALALGLSPLVVGLTVVAFGTSAPEMAVSVQSAQRGEIDLALGNVVGSNIFNALFILGISAVVAPLIVNIQLIRQEVPVMIGASVLLIVLALDGRVGFFDGMLLFGLLIVYTVVLVVRSRRESAQARAEYEHELPAPRGWDRHWSVQMLLVVAGLVLLVLGSRLLIDAAVTVARALGVSELIVGLTIVAAGTSLPEVATSVMATIRGERDIAVGNVVGSNTFNLLGVLGFTAIAAPGALPVPPSMIAFDLPVMLAAAVACLPVFLTGRTIARWEGVVFLGYYVAYTAYLVLAAQRHDGAEALRDVMLYFVVPLTVLTLAVSVWRHARASQGSPGPARR